MLLPGGVAAIPAVRGNADADWVASHAPFLCDVGTRTMRSSKRCRATCLRARYAKSGTDLARGGPRSTASAPRPRASRRSGACVFGDCRGHIVAEYCGVGGSFLGVSILLPT
eukprot:3669258-Rhodomonas_salina.2